MEDNKTRYFGVSVVVYTIELDVQRHVSFIEGFNRLAMGFDDIFCEFCLLAAINNSLYPHKTQKVTIVLQYSFVVK